MDQPGIEMRPIVQITGTSEFNEVFFDDARTASDLVVGEVNGGWRVAMGTLGFERGVLDPRPADRLRAELDLMLETARRDGGPTTRSSASAWPTPGSACELMRCERPAHHAPGEPGPETSIYKLYWATLHRDLGELAMDVLGAEGRARRGGLPGGEPTSSPSCRLFLFTRADTIYGGSNQIQRNVLGEQVLGLPKEPT